MTRFRPLVLLFAVVLAHCASLEPIAADACGNGVVDANEDCDSFPVSTDNGPQCGAPAEGALACRMKCSKGGPACPDGWGCGESGYCRRPSGAFEAKADPISAGVVDVVGADFDGDGRADVAGFGEVGPFNTTSLRVHYLEASGALARVVTTPPGLVSPTIADLDGDGLADIAFGVAGGPSGLLGVITGTKKRTFSPMLFPSFALDQTSAQIVVIRPTRLPLPSREASAVLMFGKTEGELVAFLASIGPDRGGSQFAQTLPADPDKLVGEPVWGDVFDSLASSTCGEVAYVLQVPGQDRLSIVSPCQPGDDGASKWASARPAIRVDLPAKATGGPIIIDVDHDGHRDVAVPTADGVYVVRSNGTTFGAVSVDASLKDPFLGRLVGGLDIDGDGFDDRIFESGVRLTNAPPPVQGDGGTEAGPPPGTGFDAFQVQGTIAGVRLGRINDDAFNDLVLFQKNSPDVMVVAGAARENGVPRFTNFTLTTNGAVQRIAIGDYDGDHVEDIAILTGASTDDVELSIAYGRAVGAPEPPLFIGRVRNVVAMETMRLIDNDAAESLGILSAIPSKKKDVRPTAAFALVFGSGDRQQLAPLILEDRLSKRPRDVAPAFGTRPWYPATFAAGATGTPGVPDIALVAYGPLDEARDSPLLAGVWKVAAQREAAVPFRSPTEVTVLDERIFLDKGLATFLAIADLDRASDGRAETVLLGNDPAGRARLRVMTPDGVAGAPIPIDGVLAPGRSRLALLDVDGDGFDDAVMTLVGPNDLATILIAWNDGKGGLGGAPLTVAIPPDPSFEGGDTAARGFALVTTGGADAVGTNARKETRLAVVTARRLLLGATANRTMTFADPKLFGRRGLTNATGITSGDFDGDGVPDLALADSGELRIVHQKPRLK